MQGVMSCSFFRTRDGIETSLLYALVYLNTGHLETLTF
jgi:hypothetical protein